MRRKLQMVQNAAALGVALLFLGVTLAQPPRGRDDRRNPGDRKPDAPAKVDPEVEAWVKTLTEKLTDKNEAVRDSARAALVQVGSAALPALKKLSESKDEATVAAAKGVIGQIENRGQRGFGGFNPGGRGGFPGRGPGTPDKPEEKGKEPAKPEAQPDRPRGPGGFGGGMFERLTKDLDLTDKQKDKVKDIVAAHEKKLREMFEKARDGGRPDFEKIRETMKTLHEGLVKDLKGVLTAEQLKKVEKALESGPGGLRGPGGDRPGPGGDRPGPGGDRRGPGGAGFLEQALKDLDLNDKQKDKVKVISETHEKKVRELLEKGRPDAEALKKVHDDLMKELKGVLTAEQFTKFEKAMQQRGPGGRPGQPGENRPRGDF